MGLGDLLKLAGGKKSQIIKAAEILTRGNYKGFLDNLPEDVRAALIQEVQSYQYYPKG
jgi:hypothetical protein